MRQYELLYIIKPDLDEEAVAQVMERFKGVAEQQGGEVTHLDKWSKRRLAYEIENYREGLYIIMNFKGAPAVADELDRLLKINDSVLRHVIAREEE